MQRSLLFLLGACSSSTGSTTIAHTFDPCQPLHVDAPAATADQAASIDAGAALWGDLGFVAPTRAAVDGAPSLSLVFQVAAPPFHGQYDDVGEKIYINSDLGDPDQRAITIAHELGHAFGLLHVPADQRVSVMNPGNLTVRPTPEDRAALIALWGACGGS